MKNQCVIFFLLFALVGSFATSAQVYVDGNATGANNGSSWVDAYVSLQDAFDGSSPGDEIWIAAGTYLPRISGDTIDAFFSLPHDLVVYGGFTGTESSVSQRDWLANETVLTGDHLGDDIAGNFDLFKADNSKHVMWITDTITSASRLDGLTISHGNTAPSDGSGEDRRGGGILMYGSPIVQNCLFTQNWGHFGGGVYPRGAGAADIQFLDCRFENNAGTFGAGIYINSPSGTIINCTFSENQTTSLGGAIYNRTANGTTIASCEFSQNSSIDSRGGAIYNTETPSTISNCTFSRNRAVSSSGGAVQIRNDNANPQITVTIQNCTFDRNEARWGGALGVYDRKAHGLIMDCEFTNNSSSTAGGATTNAFGGATTIINSNFTTNSSDIGGAMYNQNDSARITILSCGFTDNMAITRGGAMNFGGDNDPQSTQPLSAISISRTTLLSNTSLEQGGALNISNVDLSIDNSLFAVNFVINVGGIGGAISLNTSDSITANYSLMNNTFTLNTADFANAISNWEADATSNSTLTIQNTIFDNVGGENYLIELGDPTVISGGGNHSDDNSFASYFTATNDVNNEAPGFIDPFGSFELKDNSPCVNTGISAGSGPLDLLGNPRLGNVDKGAYENQNIVGIFSTQRESFGTLDVYPIPAVDKINFTLENEWKGEMTIQLVDMQGRILWTQQYLKTTSILENNIDIQELNKGVYLLKATNGRQTSNRSIIK